MRQEAHLIENEFVKGEWTDELIFALLDREWAAGPAADGGLR
jgi:RimJ/RimL family protein N-acetyltransferase